MHPHLHTTALYLHGQTGIKVVYIFIFVLQYSFNSHVKAAYLAKQVNLYELFLLVLNAFTIY